MWTQLFSIFTVIISAVVVFKKFPTDFYEIRNIGFIALAIWLIGDIIPSINIPAQEFLHLILQSTSISLVLVIFLQFIRQRKPIIFRYPYYMVFAPLLIPIAQFIVMEAQIMREIIFMSLQGAAILVYVFLSFGYSEKLQNKLITIIGVILLIWGFAFFWILQEYYIVFEWAWALTNTGGVIACIYSFSDLLTAIKNTKFAKS